MKTKCYIGISKYRYDFLVPKYKLLIEFDGLQHYEFVSYFHKNLEGFKAQLRRDKEKNAIAELYGYKLLRIKYTLSKSKIINIIKKECNL